MNLNEFFSLAALLYISSMSFQMYWYTSTVTSGWRYISFVVVNVSKCITELQYHTELFAGLKTQGRRAKRAARRF